MKARPGGEKIEDGSQEGEGKAEEWKDRILEYWKGGMMGEWKSGERKRRKAGTVEYWKDGKD